MSRVHLLHPTCPAPSLSPSNHPRLQLCVCTVAADSDAAPAHTSRARVNTFVNLPKMTLEDETLKSRPTRPHNCYIGYH